MTKQETRKKLFDILHDERLSWTPDSVDALQMAIDALESAQPEHLKGKWVHRYDDYNDWLECSQCGYGSEGEVKYGEDTNYCSNCGADMRKEVVDD